MYPAIHIPASFRYKDILFRERPIHDKSSAFYAQHPPMPASRWAKIFAPFDALRGFNECIASREVLYTERKLPDECEILELNRKIGILKDLIRKSRAGKAGNMNPICGRDSDHIQENRADNTEDTDQTGDGCANTAGSITITITFFQPVQSDDRGFYKTISGVVHNVDTDLSKTITVDNTIIKMADIISLRLPVHYDADRMI